MAVRGLSINETKDYILTNDPDKENPTIFVLRYLDSLILQEIQDIITTFEMNPNNSEDAKALSSIAYNKQNVELVRFALADIKNFLDKDDKAIEFKKISVKKCGKQRFVPTDEVLGQIPVAVINELAGEIRRMAKLSDEEEKN
jgi:hypothetical protein